MIIVMDFESFYSKEYSLSKMTTESYIRDPRFKVHGVGIQVDGERPAVYFRDCHVTTALKTLAERYPDAAYLMHNARFDAAILSWRYNIRPAFLLDTLSMARAVFPHESHSLANLSKLCGLGEKGKDLVNFLGVETLSDEQQAQMAEYCKNDVRLTWALYNAMKDRFNVSELKVIDRTLRMFTEPVLELDVPVLEKHLAEVQAKKAKVLGTYDLTSLRSNQQFADLLRARGVEPPMKMSLRTKKETYAFSKTDEGMLALLDHEDEEVQMLASARLGVKSSIEETRTEAMLGIASRGALPVALNYFGAGNTGRFGGAEKINVQNLPRGGALRKAIVAPEGHVLCVADFAAIEARMLAWLSGQTDLVQAFHDGEDIYCSFASRVYGRTITKADKKERFLGKVCILGLGYSMGWRKLASMLAVGPMGQAPILFTREDLDAMGGSVERLDTKGITGKLHGEALAIHCSASKHLVDSYRTIYSKIPAYWKTCERILDAMHRGVKHTFGPISTEKDRVWLPNGLSLHYKGLSRDDEGSWRYVGKRGEKQYIYSGKFTENLDQALSRIVMTDAMLKIGDRHPVCMTVHDEVVCVAKEDDADDALAYMIECMSVAPEWAAGLPLSSEGSWARSYGGAK